MKAYIYKVETNEILAIIEGDTNQDIEKKAEELNFMGSDEYGLTYSPAGLNETTDTETYSA